MSGACIWLVAVAWPRPEEHRITARPDHIAETLLRAFRDNQLLTWAGGVPDIPNSLKPSNRSMRQTKPVPDGSLCIKTSIALGCNIVVLSRVIAGDTCGRCRSSQNIVKVLRRKDDTG